MLLAYMLIFQMFSIMLIYDMISLHSENKLKALHLFKRIFETFFMTQYIFNFDSQEVKKENTAGFKTPCGCQMAIRKLPLLQSPSSSRKSRAALCSKVAGNINISIITQTGKTTERQHSLQFSLPKFHARAFSCQSIFCIWNPICKDMLEIKLLYFTQVLYRYTELFLCVRLSYKEGLIIMNSHTSCFSWKVSSIIYERLLYLL